VTDRKRPLLLSYHCSDTLVETDRLPVTILTYDLLLPCIFAVVQSSFYSYDGMRSCILSMCVTTKPSSSDDCLYELSLFPK
jgi:hypothetical protein